jgi:hypothetical protein
MSFKRVAFFKLATGMDAGNDTGERGAASGKAAGFLKKQFLLNCISPRNIGRSF